MSKYTSKKAHAFLKSDNHELDMLFSKMSALASLNEKITPHIPAGLRDHCQVANAYDDRLILIAANGSIATQLRFQSMDILRKLKQDTTLAHIKEIVCKVRPGSTSTTRSLRQSRSMQPLSVATAEIVHQIAESIEDPHLRQIMQRIASRNKNAK